MQNFQRSFGRIKTRKLKSSFLKYLNDYPVASESFCNYKKIELEIGFGYGEHLLYKAIQHPNNLFIGAETYLNGVSKLITSITEYNITNIQIYNKDCRLLINNLPDQLISKTHILFPDPWPKNKHHKRRLFSNNFLQFIYPKLKYQGEIYVITDHECYATHIENILVENSKSFSFISKTNLITEIKTRYQLKFCNKTTYHFFINKIN